MFITTSFVFPIVMFTEFCHCYTCTHQNFVIPNNSAKCKPPCYLKCKIPSKIQPNPLANSSKTVFLKYKWSKLFYSPTATENVYNKAQSIGDFWEEWACPGLSSQISQVTLPTKIGLQCVHVSAANTVRHWFLGKMGRPTNLFVQH